ncbi:MAG: hypothetical protein IPH41_08600 [Sulfuritalea sp.]|nr:hypothetical protein [Sulfuritalea sp.]
MDYYKLLQGKTEGEPTIEVEDSDSNDLKTGSSITIFGCDDGDFKGLPRVGADVLLAVSRTSTGTETFYKTSIFQSGNLDRQNRLALDPRRIAMREATRLPELLPSGDVPERVYEWARYYVTLTITSRFLTNTKGLEAARRNATWEQVSQEEYRKRVDYGDCLPKELASVTNKHLRIMQPASKAKLLSLMEMKLDERKKLSKHALIRRRIIVHE